MKMPRALSANKHRKLLHVALIGSVAGLVAIVLPLGSDSLIGHSFAVASQDRSIVGRGLIVADGHVGPPGVGAGSSSGDAWVGRSTPVATFGAAAVAALGVAAIVRMVSGYQIGDNAMVMRTDKSWSRCTVKDIKPDGRVIVSLGEDRHEKTIPGERAHDYLRPTDTAPHDAPSTSWSQARADAPCVLPFLCRPPAALTLEHLECKGVRGDADKGAPIASSRSLYKRGPCSIGAWHCTEGGFPVYSRPTTEAFIVLEGEGFLTDASDGTPHCFRAGDTVVLPKGWSGRWDILKPVRKVFAINNHEDNLDPEDYKRAIVAPTEAFNPSELSYLGKRDADWNEPEYYGKQLWKAGSTNVGGWSCTPGGFLGTPDRPNTEFFYVLEGLCFLTNTDGTAHRITAGDCVVLPKGWTGRWDIIETIRKVFVIISE